MPTVITPCGCGFEGARVRSTSDQAIPDNTQTPLSFDTVNFDTDVMFSLSSPTRLTIQTAGKYLLTGNVLFAANATGQRQTNIARNGDQASGIFLGRNVFPANTVPGLGTAVNVVAVWDFAAAEYVQLLALQSSGGSLNVLFSAVYTASFSALRVG